MCGCCLPTPAVSVPLSLACREDGAAGGGSPWRPELLPFGVLRALLLRGPLCSLGSSLLLWDSLCFGVLCSLGSSLLLWDPLCSSGALSVPQGPLCFGVFSAFGSSLLPGAFESFLLSGIPSTFRVLSAPWGPLCFGALSALGGPSLLLGAPPSQIVSLPLAPTPCSAVRLCPDDNGTFYLLCVTFLCPLFR